jgi:acetolactate synthase I/II/III large subunit
MTTVTPASDSGATAANFLLEGLLEAGMRRFFCNLGTDHVTLIEELARWKAEGKPLPDIFLCPHENVAVHMAGGYALATGEGQAVLVHVDAGTANSAMALHNLFRGRVPVMLIAGKSPFTLRGELSGSRDNYVHFVQDPFDIASLVRPYIKWEYSLPDGVVAKEVIRRANSVMQSDPPGPVYLTLPRETLAMTRPSADVASFPERLYGAVRQGGIDAETCRTIADKLAAARNPIVITSYLGRNPDAVGSLERLAAACAMPVYEVNPTVLNISRKSIWFGGYQADRAMAAADLVLLLDVDVPWLPKYAPANPNATYIQIDLDAIKADMPLWGFGAEIRVQADCGKALDQLHEQVKRTADAEFGVRVANRTRHRLDQLETGVGLKATVSGAGSSNAFAVEEVFKCLAELLDDADVLINEAIRNANALLEHVPRVQPGTYFCNAGGGLGFSGGVALGVKLAKPASRVVQVVGDGSFHFGAPTAVYAMAQQYALPILTIVLDNGGWRAVKEAVLRVHGDGSAAATNQFLARLEGETRQFEKVGEAFGAHGEAVKTSDEIRPALERCIAMVDSGRAAVLRVVLPPI